MYIQVVNDYSLSLSLSIYLSSQMQQEEKWPVFQTSPKMSAKFPKDTTNTLQPESGELFEEMSGMVTLKRKTKEKGNGVGMADHTSQNRTVSSRPESPYQSVF